MYREVSTLAAMIFVVFVVSVLSLLYYYYVTEIKKYKSLLEVPGPRGNFLLGSALDFKSSEGKICVASDC